MEIIFIFYLVGHPGFYSTGAAADKLIALGVDFVCFSFSFLTAEGGGKQREEGR